MIHLFRWLLLGLSLSWAYGRSRSWRKLMKGPGAELGSAWRSLVPRGRQGAAMLEQNSKEVSDLILSVFCFLWTTGRFLYSSWGATAWTPPNCLYKIPRHLGWVHDWKLIFFVFFPWTLENAFFSKQGSLSSLLLLQINTGLYFYNLLPPENGDWAFIPALHKDVCFNGFYLDDSPSALGLLKQTFLELLPSAESTEVVSTSHVARCWHFQCRCVMKP